jgi:hypothetical protein
MSTETTKTTEQDNKNINDNKKKRRSYNKKSLSAEFGKSQLIDAYQYYVSEGKISKPLFMEPFQKMSKEEILKFIEPKHCPDFALYLRKKQDEKKNRFENATIQQKTIAKQLLKYSKQHILKVLIDKKITIPGKQSMKIEDLAFDVALLPEASEILKLISKEFQPKATSVNNGSDKESSDSDSEPEPEKVKKRKSKPIKRQKKKDKSLDSDSSSESENSESESSEESQESDSENEKKVKRSKKKKVKSFSFEKPKKRKIIKVSKISKVSKLKDDKIKSLEKRMKKMEKELKEKDQSSNNSESDSDESNSDDSSDESSDDEKSKKRIIKKSKPRFKKNKN